VRTSALWLLFIIDGLISLQDNGEADLMMMYYLLVKREEKQSWSILTECTS
jgi:hypothetical protein